MNISALILAFSLVLIFNIPFGYWRANVNKFSWQWILAIHIPVPFILVLRFVLSIGFAWYTYVILVAAFFLGQRLGYSIHKLFLNHEYSISSCLFVDIKRIYFN